jgi:perosamine synthetase
MIPRLKPFLGKEELTALMRPITNSVQQFEIEFAKTFGSKYALAFPYGRSALWAFFKAMSISGAEIVQPAYTCSVVGHATVLSGNRPVFVDISSHDYVMNLDLFKKAITQNTRAVLPTHLFGYPMDIDSISEIVRNAEKRFGKRIYIIQDCAHSFEAEWKGRSVINAGDGALFGLNISKQITSIFGGMFTTNDAEIAGNMRLFRDTSFSEKTFFEKIKRTLYLPAAVMAFSNPVYGLTFWLQNNTPLLKHLTDAYHLDERIHFPPDFQKHLSSVEGCVGLAQLIKYPEIKARRRMIAEAYFDQLHLSHDWVMPPRVE